MLTLAHVMDLFANEFSGLSRGGLALASIFLGSLNCLALWHNQASFRGVHYKGSIGRHSAESNPTFTVGQSDIFSVACKTAGPGVRRHRPFSGCLLPAV